MYMRLFSFLFLLLFTIASHAGENNIRFYDGTWTATKQEAAKSGKLIFLDCYTDWCYWCKVMDKEAFMDTSVTNLINSKFVPAKREMEKNEEGKALGMKYHVNGYPSYLVFDAKGTLVYKIVGYRKPEEFKEELNKALQAKSPLHPGFSAELDPGFPDFYKRTFGTSKERRNPDPKIPNNFLEKQTDLFSEVAWAVMWRFTVNEKYETWIIDNKVKLSELYGKDEVNGKIINILFARVERAAAKKDEQVLKSSVAMVNEEMPEEASWLSLQLSLDYYRKAGEWKSYSDVVQSYINTNGYSSTAIINDCSWAIYEECSNADVVKQAVTWMENVCTETDNYAYEDTYAALLYKSGDYKKAEAAALHAIDVGKKAGEDISSTESLLANIRLKLK